MRADLMKSSENPGTSLFLKCVPQVFLFLALFYLNNLGIFFYGLEGLPVLSLWYA